MYVNVGGGAGCHQQTNYLYRHCQLVGNAMRYISTLWQRLYGFHPAITISLHCEISALEYIVCTQESFI